MNKIIAIVVIGILVIGGIYLKSESKDKDMISDSKITDQAMMQKDLVKDKAMMEDGSTVMENKKEMMVNKDAMSGQMMKTGSYEVYSPEKIAKASTGKVVLFFRAVWCPTCKTLDADIKANLSKIPENVTILDVDYDKYSDLKKKYGVTYQHTLVQVDKDGNMITKWSASPTLSDIVSKIK